MLNALPARKILLSTLKVWESGAGVKTVTSVRSVMDPLHGRKLGIVRMFGSNLTDVIYLQSTMTVVGEWLACQMIMFYFVLCLNLEQNCPSPLCPY